MNPKSDPLSAIICRDRANSRIFVAIYEVFPSILKKMHCNAPLKFAPYAIGLGHYCQEPPLSRGVHKTIEVRLSVPSRVGLLSLASIQISCLRYIFAVTHLTIYVS